LASFADLDDNGDLRKKISYDDDEAADIFGGPVNLNNFGSSKNDDEIL